LASSCKKDTEKKDLYFKELYKDIKVGKLKRSFASWFLLRRGVLAIWVVLTIDYLDLTPLLATNATIHLASFLYMAVIKPFENKSDNFVEIMNELQVTLISSVFIFIQKESEWTIIHIYTIIFSLLLNSFIIALISLITLLCAFKKCLNKKKSKQGESKVACSKP
jgi:hypothetical protein